MINQRSRIKCIEFKLEHVTECKGWNVVLVWSAEALLEMLTWYCRMILFRRALYDKNQRLSSHPRQYSHISLSCRPLLVLDTVWQFWLTVLLMDCPLVIPQALIQWRDPGPPAALRPPLEISDFSRRKQRLLIQNHTTAADRIWLTSGRIWFSLDLHWTTCYTHCCRTAVCMQHFD